jgi:competence protein ComEC
MRFERSSSGAAAARPEAVPLFHAAWLFAMSIIATHWLWLPPAILLNALAGVAILCCVAAIRAQKVIWLPLSVLWCLLGIWCRLMEPQSAPAPQIAGLSDGLMRAVEGSIVDVGPIRNEAELSINDDGVYDAAPALELTQRIDVRVRSLEEVSDTIDHQAPASGTVRLTVRWPAGTMLASAANVFQCGDLIRADARLLRPAVFHDPGVWNRADYLLDQGITSTASMTIDRIGVAGHDAGEGIEFRCRLAAMQHATTARLMMLPAAMASRRSD